MKGRKKRILALGQAGRQTGYARVMSNILSRLSDTFDITLLAVDYQGPEIHSGYKVVPNTRLGDQLGKAQFPRLLTEYEPDLVFLCHDHTFYSVHQCALDEFRRRNRRLRVVVYCPIEFHDTPRGNLTPLAGADCVVFYTKFGLAVFERACADAGIPRVPSTTIIPHGLDSSIFYPLSSTRNESRRLARLELFPDRPELQDAFIVLNANRNCPRKRIDLTLRAFAEFARGKRDTYLYVHMGMIDSGYDILALATSLSIDDRLLVTPASERRPNVPDWRLNLIYNACDVGVNTATGEGWGFVAFEHGATLAAQLVPDHSACRELWKGAGGLIGLQDSALEGSSHSAGVVSIRDLSRWLNRLYARPELLLDYAERAYRHARGREFRWDTITQRWQGVFTGLWS